MKKKYITLEEVLALKGTDTKIYEDGIKDGFYYQFKDGFLCLMKGGDIEAINDRIYSDNLYILEPEESFKIDKTGKYRTRDGRIAFVSNTFDNGFQYYICGIIEGFCKASQWDLRGTAMDATESDDLVEYIGD